jgi:O-antigen/teichoic acid export membrane protein
LSSSKKISALNKLLAGTAGIFATGLGLSFIFNWVMTKVLPKEEVGFFQYYISIILLGTVIIPFGYQSLIQREGNKLNRAELKRFNLQTFSAISIVSILFGAFWYYGVTQLNWVKGLTNFEGLYVSLCILPLYSLLCYYRSLLQAQNKVYWSVIPEVLFRPLSLLIATAIFYFISFDTKAYHLLLVLLGIIFILVLPSAYQSKKNLTKELLKQDNTNWLKQSLALLPIGLLYTVNERIDVIMVSKYLSASQTAVYMIAFKFAAFSGFGLVIVNSVLVPLMAKHFSEKQNNKKLESLLKPNARKALFVSALISIVLIFMGEYLLSFFGKSTDNYSEGYYSMIILIIGQLANVSIGSVGYILTMAKLEKLALICIATSIITNVLLNYLLLPIYGINGAAIATALAMFTWNSLMLFFVKQKTGLNPTVF